MYIFIEKSIQNRQCFLLNNYKAPLFGWVDTSERSTPHVHKCTFQVHFQALTNRTLNFVKISINFSKIRILKKC